MGLEVTINQLRVVEAVLRRPVVADYLAKMLENSQFEIPKYMEIELRDAIACLSDEVSKSSTVVASLQIAQAMIESYTFDTTTRVSTFTIPAGVTDVEAMKALNEYYRRTFSALNSDIVCEWDLECYENLPKEYPSVCQERDYSQARQITVIGLVNGTKKQNRTSKEEILKNASLAFADPRDQVLAAAIHACKNNGEDLFKGLHVCGSVPGFAIFYTRSHGIRISRSYVACYEKDESVAASGSPLWNQKT
jgi:hypothetical protein